jgi:hypothetical protein
MHSRFLPVVFVLGLAAIPNPARSLAGDSTPPTLTVRIRSLDSFINDIKLISKAAGHEQWAKRLDDTVKKIFPSGYQGVDTTRPIGFYGKLDDNWMDSSAVLLIPITDEKQFATLLESLRVRSHKEDDDIYSIDQEKLPVSFYFRFANGYAYVSAGSKAAIERAKLFSPEQLFNEKLPGTLSLTFRIDQIPDVYKQIALGQIETRISEAAEKKRPGESAGEHAVKAEAGRVASEAIASALKEGSELVVRLDVDSKTDAISADVSLAGKQGTKLASHIAALARLTPTVQIEMGAAGMVAILTDAVGHEPKGQHKSNDSKSSSKDEPVAKSDKDSRICVRMNCGPSLQLHVAVGASALRLLHISDPKPAKDKHDRAGR